MDLFNPSTIFISKTFFSHENTKEKAQKLAEKRKIAYFAENKKKKRWQRKYKLISNFS